MKARFTSRTEQLKVHGELDWSRHAQVKDTISFAGELPSEQLLPVRELLKEAGHSYHSDSYSGSELQRHVIQGNLPLREHIAHRLTQRGVRANAGQLLITTGFEQALDFVLRILTEPGDAVLVERPTHPALLKLLKLHGLQAIEAECDEAGMSIDSVDQLITAHRPRLICCMPAYGNPVGRTWSVNRREQLLQLSKRYGILILEDDSYGGLAYSGETSPTILSLDERLEGSTVIHTSSCASMAFPGLHVGWIAGDSRIIQQLSLVKDATGSYLSEYDQHIAWWLLNEAQLDSRLAAIAEVSRAGLEVVERCLADALVPGLSWSKPEGGMFVWMELPDGLNAEALLRCAVGKGAAFKPGGSFYATNPRMNTARLNLASCNGQEMQLGIQRIVESIGEFTARS